MVLDHADEGPLIDGEVGSGKPVTVKIEGINVSMRRAAWTICDVL
jgi:hypothetical protein